MYIHNNTLDLIGRQMSEKSSSRDRQDVDDAGGFRELLKGRSQRDQETGSDRKLQEKPETPEKPETAEKPEQSEKTEQPEKMEKEEPVDEKTDDKDAETGTQSTLADAVAQAIQDMLSPDPTDEGGEKKEGEELIPHTLFGDLSVQELKAQKIQNLTVGEEPALEEIGELPQTDAPKDSKGENAQSVADLLNSRNGADIQDAHKTDAQARQIQQAEQMQQQAQALSQDRSQRISSDKKAEILQDSKKAEDVTETKPVITVKAQGKQADQSAEQLSMDGEKTAEKPRQTETGKENAEINTLVSETPREQVREVKTETIKDLKKPVVVNAGHPEQLPEKLSEQILRQVRNGRNELDVQLEPENLGKIHIRVSYDDNQMNVAVICSESKTLRLLSQSAGDLGHILENNLERPVQIVVDKQEPDYLNNQEQQEQQGQDRQESRQEKQESSEDFVQKLRLGLVDINQFDQGGISAWQG